MKMIARLASVLALMTVLYGCGGGDGGGAPANIPVGKATLVFSVVSTARLPVSVSGIDFIVTLPVGMNVATTSGGSGQIETASILPGEWSGGTSLAFGSYSASRRTAHLSMATTSDTFRGGDFLRLACTVSSDAIITYNQILALNTPMTVAKVVGYDPVTHSTVVMTDKLNVTLGVLP